MNFVALSLTGLKPLFQRLCAANMLPEQVFHYLGRLLFIKLCRVPAADWHGLVGSSDMLADYLLMQDLLADDPELSAIFDNFDEWPSADTLQTAIHAMNALDWLQIRQYGRGEVFEQFLYEFAPAKPARLSPPELATVLAGLLQPEPGEAVVDPFAACGTLLSAAHAFRLALLQEDPATYLTRQFSHDNGLYGREQAPDYLRLARMNLYLQDMPNQLTETTRLPPADVLLSNIILSDEADEAQRCQAELAIWQRCLQQMKPGGRGMLLLSDASLEHASGQALRTNLLGRCEVHTLLRLPDGFFYGEDLSAHALFFTAGHATGHTWIYDLRTGLPWFDPDHLPFQAHYLNPFIDAFGELPEGTGRRKDGGEHGRFRCFNRAELVDENLLPQWLSEDNNEFPFFHAVSTPAHHREADNESFTDALDDLQALRDLLSFS